MKGCKKRSRSGCKIDTKVDENKGVKGEANMDVKGGATRVKCTN